MSGGRRGRCGAPLLRRAQASRQLCKGTLEQPAAAEMLGRVYVLLRDRRWRDKEGKALERITKLADDVAPRGAGGEGDGERGCKRRSPIRRTCDPPCRRPGSGRAVARTELRPRHLRRQRPTDLICWSVTRRASHEGSNVRWER